MTKLTRYRCTYCGTDDVCETLTKWDLDDKRCKHCNHGKFDTKPVPDSSNIYGYDDDKELDLPWAVD